MAETTLVKRQYVWSLAYVDALVLRDREVDSNVSTGDLGAAGSGLDERMYVMQDANWNVTGIVNKATGQVAERYIYDPYGSVTFLNASWGTLSASAYVWVYMHQGGRWDAFSNTYHFRNRDYSPTLGRWMQQDPLGYVDGGSLYEYERSRPTGVLDPLGLWHYEVNGPYFTWDPSTNTAYAMFTHNKAPGWLDRWVPGAAPIDFFDWFTTKEDYYETWYPLHGVSKRDYDDFLSQGRLSKCPDKNASLLVQFQLDRMSGVERGLVEGLNNIDVTAGPLAANAASLVALGTVNISLLHPESTLTSGSSKFSYDYWSNQSTPSIVDSLKPGAKNPLVVDASGLVWDGNTRILILQQRGVDVNKLPRTPK